MAKRRQKDHKQRGMGKKNGKKPMKEEQKAEQKKLKEHHRQMSKADVEAKKIVGKK